MQTRDIPPPSGHSAGTNEATMAPTPENAPCWHQIGRPGEILMWLRARELHDHIHADMYIRGQ